jgi:hypothetical protein
LGDKILVLLMTHHKARILQIGPPTPHPPAGGNLCAWWADAESCRQQKTSFGCVSAASLRCLANNLRQPTGRTDTRFVSPPRLAHQTMTLPALLP